MIKDKTVENFGNTCESPVQGVADDETRLFSLHDRSGKEFEVAVKDVGFLEEIFSKLQTEDKEGIKAPKGLLEIIEAYRNYRTGIPGKKPHLLVTGGFVRDILSGKAPNDVDLATDLLTEESYALLKEKLGEAKKIGVHGEASEVVRVNFKNGEEYEISTFKSPSDSKGSYVKSPSTDSGARDLTVNAIFYNPMTGHIIDYAGGMEDIKNRRLRFTGSAEARINEDPLRMLRYVRFLIKTGFSADPEHGKVIREKAGLLQRVAKERLKAEMDKILALASSRVFLEKLDEYGLLQALMPEIRSLKDCEQGPPYHLEGDVFKHTLMVSDELPDSAGSRLKWAVIFHDIAKPGTREEKIKEDLRKVSFIGHDKLGAKMAEEVMDRLGFSKKESSAIGWIIENHQSIFQNTTRRLADSPDKEKAFKKAVRYFIDLVYELGGQDIFLKPQDPREAQDFENRRKYVLGVIDDLVALAIADTKGKDSGSAEGQDDAEIIARLYREARKEIEDILNAKKVNVDSLVTGKLIMEGFNIKPGPQVGKIQKLIKKTIKEKNSSYKSYAKYSNCNSGINDLY